MTPIWLFSYYMADGFCLTLPLKRIIFIPTHGYGFWQQNTCDIIF